MNSTDFCMIRTLVLNYLNERCGLPPGRGLSCDVIHSKEVYLVLELKTNYKRGVPGGFRLPDHDIDLRDPDEFLFRSKSLVSMLHKPNI